MQLLVTLSVRNGYLSSPLTNERNQKSLNFRFCMFESVQDLRESHNVCGLAEPLCKLMDTIEITGSPIRGTVFDNLKYDFCTDILDANTTTHIIEKYGELIEMTMIFTNIPVSSHAPACSLETLQKLTSHLTLSEFP